VPGEVLALVAAIITLLWGRYYRRECRKVQDW